MCKFVYPYKNIKQLATDGKDLIVRDISGPGHMVRGDTNITLCGVTKEELSKEANGRRRSMTIDKSVIFLHYWNILTGSPEPVPEYRFHPDRKWRFDWAFLEQKVAVEVEGNAWRVPGGGRHMQDSDLEKYNNAALLGWRVFRFSPKMLKEKPVECTIMIKEALEAFK